MPSPFTRGDQVYNKPSCSFAASDILLMSHVGSHTTSTQASLTLGTVFALALTSPGRVWAAGQAGEVSVRRIPTNPSAFTSMS